MSLIRPLIALARDRNLTFLAAGIAYYAFVSLIPLLLLVVAVSSAIGGEALVTRVTELLSQQLSSSGEQIVTETLSGTTGRGIASVFGALALLWSALKVFRGVDQAFDEVYTDEVETSLVEQLRNAIVVILGTGLAFALVIAVSVVLFVLPLEIPFIDVLGTLALVAVLTVAFLPIYYVLPPVDVSLGEVLPGAVIAGVGWVLLQVGFRIYVANAGRYEAYGLIGAALLFVTWLYFASILLLLGAAVNVVRREDGHTVPTSSSQVVDD